MLNVPRHIATAYRALTTLTRKSHYLLGELVLHPDCNLDDPAIRKQIMDARKQQAQVTVQRAKVEELIWRNYANGRELVKQQRAMIKGEK